MRVDDKPPAGGEVEVLAWRRFYTSRTESSDLPYEVTDFHDNHEFGEKNADTPLVDRAHVTRLQVEVGQWKSVSQDIAERRDELKRELDMRDGQRDTLKAELDAERLEHAETERISQQEELRANDYARQLVAAQSELTKARELLKEPKELCAISSEWFDKRDEFLAYQSAPAAKGEPRTAAQQKLIDGCWLSGVKP